MYMSISKKGNRKIKNDFFRVMRMWEFFKLIFLIFVIAVMLFVPLKTVLIHHVNEPVAVAFLYFVALLSHKITPPAIHGLSSGGRTGRRSWVCRGWGLRICTKAPKDVTVLLQGQDALFF